MSIINEALKKTEEHLLKNSAKDNPLSTKTLAPKPFMLYILILIAGLLLGSLIFNLLKHLPQNNTSLTKKNSLTFPSQAHRAQTQQTPVENTQPIVQTTDSSLASIPPNQPLTERKPDKANFILNGIFFSDNDGYALINNQIVRENDYIDGAKVSLITANNVQLDSAGQTITLTTPR